MSADTALVACPYCLAQKHPDAPVCPACNRDTMAPAALIQERDELLRHRDALRAEIDMKSKRLSR